MKKILVLLMVFVLSACTTKYILMDENGNPVKEGYYTENTQNSDGFLDSKAAGEILATNDVFVVNEGSDFVTYQYKNVRVDEISPLASLYCADASFGGSSYLREVSMYHDGFMRATFDCLNVAI